VIHDPGDSHQAAAVLQPALKSLLCAGIRANPPAPVSLITITFFN
jgi:hypothetical protein